MTIIRGLGVPSVNDRDLRLVSTLSPETALQGSTDLLYVDTDHEHVLPEVYNGLGFKNLIYMAVQISYFPYTVDANRGEKTSLSAYLC